MSVSSPTAKSGKDDARLPGAVVWTVLVLCVLPALLIWAGIDFSSLLPDVPHGEVVEDPFQDPGSIFHSLSEWTSTCIALFAALLAFLYIYQKRDPLVLVIGITMLLVGILEAAHTFSSHGLHVVVGDRASLIPLTWAISRFGKAGILGVGVAFIIWKQPGFRRVGFGSLLGFGVFGGVVLYFVTLSWTGNGLALETFSPDSLVKRPWDVPPLVIFLGSGLYLFPLLRIIQPGILSHALLVSVAPDVASQLHVVFGSRRLYDGHFNIAHFLEIVGLLVPLIGLALHFVQAHRRELTATERLEKAVGGLQRETQQREQVEKELRSKEVRLNQLTENIREVFWIVVPGAREWIYVSPAYEQVFGRSCESLYRDPFSLLEAVHPEDRNRIRSMMQQVSQADMVFDFRIIRPDGQTRWIRVRAFPVLNEAGEVFRVAGISEDVTEQKEAEAALRKTEAKNQALLNAIPDLMFRLSRSGVYLDYHARDATKLRVHPREFLGKKVSDTFPELWNRISRAVELALATGTVQIIEYRFDEIDFGMHDYEARIVKGGEDEVLAIVRDITEQKHLERQILEISGREQQRIGHDLHDGISQQLAGIALLGKVLHQKLEAKTLTEASDARRIVDLVNDTIAQTRNLARGLSPVQLEEQGLLAALEELAMGVESFHSVSCRFRCAEKILIEDHATATHLYRIAQEAVNNALKHGEPSQIDIELESSNEHCTLTVRDNGKGIPDDLAGGDGMGFHIMQYRARMIDASFDIRRAPKGGTMVVCELTNDSVKSKAGAP
jgi:PAS domain S-box-containing protein